MINTKFKTSCGASCCFFCLLAGMLPPATSSLQAGQTIVDFDELNGYSSTTDKGSYFDGYGSGAVEGSWTTADVLFNTGQFGSGWSYSNLDDPETGDFTNQWAAIPGADSQGSGNYVIGNESTFDTSGLFFNLPVRSVASSLLITNTTYAGLVFQDGNGFAKVAGGESGDDPDYFRVTFTGFDQSNGVGGTTGSAEFYLGDYRFEDNDLDYVVTDWRILNLESLGSARSIGVSFDGSDVGQFGLNTPAYVAIDNLTLVVVPEPNSAALLAMGGVLLAHRRRRNLATLN